MLVAANEVRWLRDSCEMWWSKQPKFVFTVEPRLYRIYPKTKSKATYSSSVAQVCSQRSSGAPWRPWCALGEKGPHVRCDAVFVFVAVTVTWKTGRCWYERKTFSFLSSGTAERWRNGSNWQKYIPLPCCGQQQTCLNVAQIVKIEHSLSSHHKAGDRGGVESWLQIYEDPLTRKA